MEDDREGVRPRLLEKERELWEPNLEDENLEALVVGDSVVRRLKELLRSLCRLLDRDVAGAFVLVVWENLDRDRERDLSLVRGAEVVWAGACRRKLE